MQLVLTLLPESTRCIYCLAARKVVQPIRTKLPLQKRGTMIATVTWCRVSPILCLRTDDYIGYMHMYMTQNQHMHEERTLANDTRFWT